MGSCRNAPVGCPRARWDARSFTPEGITFPMQHKLPRSSERHTHSRRKGNINGHGMMRRLGGAQCKRERESGVCGKLRGKSFEVTCGAAQSRASTSSERRETEGQRERQKATDWLKASHKCHRDSTPNQLCAHCKPFGGLPSEGLKVVAFMKKQHGMLVFGYKSNQTFTRAIHCACQGFAVVCTKQRAHGVREQIRGCRAVTAVRAREQVRGGGEGDGASIEISS